MNIRQSDYESSRLSRKLGAFDAIVVGLGSMIGAGIFAVLAPAAAAAGTGLLAGLLIAGLVAYANALSSASLAARYPQSGGTYVYGRERLGRLWGFVAGWGFVVGKLASCAAMALTFASYAAPAFLRPLAVGAVLVLTTVNYFGIEKTARLTRVIVAFVLLALGTVVAIAMLGEHRANDERLLTPTHAYGVLQAAGLWFFAFAGYARLATLGEEVEDPSRILPRAIPWALGLTLLIYAAVAVAAVSVVDVEALASSEAPLALVVETAGAPQWALLVRAGASVASLGVLMSLIVGVSRTTFAMAANGDLPRWLAAVHARHKVPHRAELAVGILVALVVGMADVRAAIGFSAFTILVYYMIANAAALTLGGADRGWRLGVAIAGLAGCIVLAGTLPFTSVIAGSAVLVIGVVLHLVRGASSSASSGR